MLFLWKVWPHYGDVRGGQGHSCDLMALDSFHATPFAWVNWGNLVCARLDSVFYNDAASVCFSAKRSSRPSLALPPVLWAIRHSGDLGYIPEEVLVASFTTIC